MAFLDYIFNHLLDFLCLFIVLAFGISMVLDAFRRN